MEHDALVMACIKGKDQLMRQLLSKPATENLGPCFECGYHTGDTDNPEHVKKLWPAEHLGGESSNTYICKHRDWIAENKSAPCRGECWVDASTGTVRNRYPIQYPYFLDNVTRCVLSREVEFRAEMEVRNRKQDIIGYADLLVTESLSTGESRK